MATPILLLAEKSTYFASVRPLLGDYTVLHCLTAAEGAVLCRQYGVQLVLLAKNIAEQPGCTVFSELRKLCPEVSGLLLTETEDTVLLRQAIDAGISGLIDLPLDGEQLRIQVEKVLESTTLRQENGRLRTLLPLYNLGEQFLASFSKQEVLDSLLDEVVKQTGVRHVSVMLFDAGEECLRIAAARGMDKELVESIRVEPGDQIAGWVYQQGKPVILNRGSQEKSSFAPLLKRKEIVSSISFPLLIRGRIIGVLNISRTADDAAFFSEADNEMLGIVCGQAALALENVRSLDVAKETIRMRTLFEQYVAPEVAEILLDSEDNIMDLGEVKEVTVLFADIRNFTSLVQHLELSALRTFLNSFFQIFTEAIYHNHGTVDKFMGDAVLAVFGAPIPLNNASLAAANAARAIRDRFEALRLDWIEQCADFKNIDLGIAITCGQVYVGNVGSTRRLDYTVIGTPVNIAQRLAAESSHCRIYITEPVCRRIGDNIATGDGMNVVLRGVEQQVKVFSIK